MAVNDYATLDDARDYGYQSQDTDNDLLESMIARASRLFDRYTGLPSGYFAKGSNNQVASARDFWGDGTDYLKVDPYLVATTPTISMPTGYTEPDFIQVNPHARARLSTNAGEFFLVRTYGDSGSRLSALGAGIDLFAAEFNASFEGIGWPDGVKVAVTAKWGWVAIPEDVKEAVLEITIAIWRNRDQGFARAVALDGNVLINDVMPPRARLIADRYRVGRAVLV